MAKHTAQQGEGRENDNRHHHKGAGSPEKAFSGNPQKPLEEFGEAKATDTGNAHNEQTDDKRTPSDNKKAGSRNAGSSSSK